MADDDNNEQEFLLDMNTPNPTNELLSFGTVTLRGDITARSCARVYDYILAENYKANLKSICLIIDSSGGEVGAAFSLISMIKASVIPIAAIATGNCSSAALFIAMSCPKRIIDRNCAILSHQYSGAFGDGIAKHEDLIARQSDFKLTASRIEQLYVSETGKPLSYIRKHLLKSHDVFIDANAAIEHGLFDGLLEENLDVLYHFTQK